MIDRFQSTLALLDAGFVIYRRHFVSFLLITAMWFVPFAIAIGLLVAAGNWLSEDVVVGLALLVAVLAVPLLIYLIGGLSRAAMAAIDNRPVTLRDALAIPPLRLVGMGCFTLVYSFVAYVVTSMVSLICICPMYLFGLAAIGGVAALPGQAIGAAAGIVFGLVFVVIYVVALVVSGAMYSSIIYALQPWVQEQRPFGEALQRSFDMIGYRFWRNGVVWGATALMVGAVGLIVTLTVGVLVPLPLLFVLGEESTVSQAISATAWMLGFVFVVPPLPIWMALLYRRNVAARDGAKLDAQVQVWWGLHFGA